MNGTELVNNSKVLANSTDILKDLCKAIQQLTVVTPVGTSSIPVNIADFASIQAKIDNIKSKKSNLE